jgi:ABC-type multidrug transport system ATPase subunit
MPVADPAVRVDGVTKRFDGDAVLDGLDVEVPAGQITLLMGPNGAGKTILLSCIAGGLYPDGGTVEVFEDPPVDARAELSFVLQDGLLVDELTGRENVAFFRDLHPGSTGDWRRVLDDLAFDTAALDREVRDYSGGMKRKLEVAIALDVDVPLYLLDEPTAALDVTTVDALHSLLVERRRAGKTVLLTSHLPGDAELADYLVFVGTGGVIASGPPERLLDGVPEVVRVEGRPDGVVETVRGRRLFEAGRERRGFLREGVDPAAVEAAADPAGTSVRVADPTVTDLFNYYVHVEGDVDR